MHETNLYSVTIPQLSKTLSAFSDILDKARTHADAKKLPWMDFEHALVNDRIVFNMFDFKKQVQVACDNAKGLAARLAEVEIPKHEDTESTIEELKVRIAKTVAFLDSIKPEQIIGKEGVKITIPYFPGKSASGFEYAVQYALPNFYFHIVTAYDILRKNGVDIGKTDFTGALPFRDDVEA